MLTSFLTKVPFSLSVARIKATERENLSIALNSMMMMLAGVPGEEDQRTGQRAALCHEGPEESNVER